MALQTKTFTHGSTDSTTFNYYVLELTLTEDKIDSSKNESQITYSLIIKSGPIKGFYCDITSVLKLNNIQVEYSDKDGLSLEKNSSLSLMSGTCSVKHNDDGSLNMPITVEIYSDQGAGNPHAPPNKTLNWSWQLTNTITKCTAPTTFTASPDIFGASGITLTWSGAGGGQGNAIVGYELQTRTRDASSSAWSGWASSTITISGQNENLSSLVYGGQAQYRIRTKGSAGLSYYSDWKTSNIVTKNTPPGIPTNPQINNLKVSDGDTIILSWSESEDVDNNHNGYRLAKTPTNGETPDVNEYITISMDITNSRDVTVSGNPGDVITYVVRAEDALGDVSDWLHIGDVTVFRFMKIFNGESWDRYIPYIFEDGESHAYAPYTYDENKWV